MAAKCECCGSGRMSWGLGAIKFKDGKYICVKCLKALGHERPLKDAYYLGLHDSAEIINPVKYRAEAEAAHEQWLHDHPDLAAVFDALPGSSTDSSGSGMHVVSTSTVRGPDGRDVEMIVTSNFGQERDLVCTEEEREIFDIIRSLCDDCNLDSEVLELVRKSDDYVSAVMRSQSGYGLMDVARIKYTNRAKWIKICPEFDRVDLSDPEDVASLAEDIWRAYIFNQKYL